jgi:hypothetical protein
MDISDLIPPSFLPFEQLDELVRFAYLSDREIRSDLAKGLINSENDYTSNLTGALRRNINTYSQSGLSATSFVLPSGDERECGGDAAIILSRENQSKVAVFEAKWPRFKTPHYQWDYAQTASGLSHFSDQLARQKKWHNKFAVFEMFYNEFDFKHQPSFLDDYGSSCVWHERADLYRAHRFNPEAIWTQDDVRELIEAEHLTIADVMLHFGCCLKGQIIQISQADMIMREYRLPTDVLAIWATAPND